MKKRRSFFRMPLARILLVGFVAAFCYLYLATLRGKPLFNSLLLFVAAMIFLVIAWVAFFSQFVLPLHKTSDRVRAFRRLVRYMLGTGGPATFVEDGDERKHAGEADRKASGVIILDSASGAVLSNGVSFTRVVGPGLVFTNANEHLAGSVDLHRKILPNPALGPKDPEDDPFGPKKTQDQEANPEEEYKQRQIRRLETSGLTRDGVEVVPNVMVVFRLERLPGDEDVSFGYNPKSVEAYVRADSLSRQKAGNHPKGGNGQKPGNDQKEGNHPKGGNDSKGGEEQKEDEGLPSGKKKEKIPLEKLPAFLAVDVWREYLQKFTLSEMFLPPILVEGNGETGLETILHMVQRRLTNFQVNELNSFGKPTGRVLHSREFEILQDCGIRVEAVILTNLRFKPDVERKLVDDWVATWLQRARLERERVEARRLVQIETGGRMAAKRLARAATRRCSTDLFQLPMPADQDEQLLQMKTTLDIFLRGTLQECILEPQLRQRLTGEQNKLSEIINWVRMQQP